MSEVGFSLEEECTRKIWEVVESIKKLKLPRYKKLTLLSSKERTILFVCGRYGWRVVN